MLNQCTFIGNLGRDPEIRTFQNGNKVCNLRIACTEKWKDRESGERKEKTEWIPIAIFSEGLIRVAEQYLSKGSKVMVQGKFVTRKWQDQSGQDRYSTEVVLQGFDAKLVILDSAQGGGQQGGQSGGYDNRDQGGYDQGSYGAGGRPGGDINDSIPFAAEGRV
jgi:single-strand DNA-binding protein